MPCEKSMCIKQGFQHKHQQQQKGFISKGGREGWEAAAYGSGVSPQPAVANKLLLIKSAQTMGLMQGVPRSSKKSMHSSYPRPACGHAALRGPTTTQPATLTGLNMTALSHSAPSACLASPRNRRARNARQTPKNTSQTELSSSCSHNNTVALRPHQTSVASGSTGTSSLATSPNLLLQCFL